MTWGLTSELTGDASSHKRRQTTATHLLCVGVDINTIRA